MRPTRNVIALVAVCLLSAMAAGCSSEDQVEHQVLEDHVDTDRQVEVDPAPPHLPYLPDYPIEICGWAEDQAAVSCFQQAQSADQGAEIFFRYGTIEGDSVFAIARLTPGGEIVLFTDYSDDAYSGPQQFRSQSCKREEFLISDGDIPWDSCAEEIPGW